MTKIGLFDRFRDSIRLLVLMMAVGLVALLGAAVACGPADTASPGAGETVTDAAAKDQPPPDGTDPIPVQQQSGTSSPTPLPTICADTVDSSGNPIKDCGPPPPVDGDDEATKIDSELQSLVDAARREQASPQGGAVGTGGQSEPLRPQRYRVWIQLTSDTDGEAIIEWLEERGFSYEDQRHTGTIYAGVDLTVIPDLSEVEGVLQLLEPIKPNPA